LLLTPDFFQHRCRQNADKFAVSSGVFMCFDHGDAEQMDDLIPILTKNDNNFAGCPKNF